VPGRGRSADHKQARHAKSDKTANTPRIVRRRRFWRFWQVSRQSPTIGQTVSQHDKYAINQKDARMDFHGEHDEPNSNDEPIAGESMDSVPAYRKRASDLLDEIAELVRHALDSEGIEIDIFFMIPNSGCSILSFGTPGNPTDAVWDQVGALVSTVVRRAIGLGDTRCRPLQCATTR
jgi:hypothetical protein